MPGKQVGGGQGGRLVECEVREASGAAARVGKTVHAAPGSPEPADAAARPMRQRLELSESQIGMLFEKAGAFEDYEFERWLRVANRIEVPDPDCVGGVDSSSGLGQEPSSMREDIKCGRGVRAAVRRLNPP